jgi:iron complex outermembrane receptor protein
MQNLSLSAAAKPQRIFARHFLSLAVAVTLISTPAYANSTALETITVTGQHHPLLIEMTLDPTQSSAPDMRNQLAQLPGISINGNGAVSGIIQYRGMFSDRVNVQIDGSVITAAGPNGMDSPLSHVIGSIGQEVTLYRGIAPVSVGAETIGGAVAISHIAPELTDSEQRTFSGGLSVSRFSFNKTHYSVSANAINHNTYISVIADKQTADNYRAGSSAGNGIVIPSSFYDRHGVKIRGGYVAKNYSIDGFVTARTTNESGTPTLAMDIIYIDALLAGLDYTQRLNNQWQLKTQVRANNNEHIMDNFTLRSNTNNAAYRENYVDSEGRSISIKASHIDAQWRSEYGVDWHTKEHYSNITNPNMAMFYLNNFNDVQRDTASVYAQWEQEKSSDLQWLFGGRYSRISADAGTVDSNMAMMNPNVANLRDAFNTAQRSKLFDLLDVVGRISLPSNESSVWTLSAGVKEQAPIYQQLYTWFPLGISAGMADGRNYLGNLDLSKETAFKVDVSAEFTGLRWRLAPSVYWSQIDNYIMGMPSDNMSANMIAQMNNIAPPLIWANEDAQIAGFDVTYQYAFSDNWSLGITGQYVKGKQTGTLNQDLYRLAPFSGDVSLSWQQEYDSNSYGFILHTELAAAQNNVAELQNETSTSGYGVVNFNGYYQFDSGLKIQLVATNIFDKTYAPHLAGVNRVTAAQLAVGDKVLSAGRTVGLNINYQFAID